MFDNWGLSEWLILSIDIVAVSIIFWFLSKKIKSKLAEVEERHAFEAQRRMGKEKNE